MWRKHGKVCVEMKKRFEESEEKAKESEEKVRRK